MRDPSAWRALAPERAGHTRRAASLKDPGFGHLVLGMDHGDEATATSNYLHRHECRALFREEREVNAFGREQCVKVALHFTWLIDGLLNRRNHLVQTAANQRQRAPGVDQVVVSVCSIPADDHEGSRLLRGL